jgi:hypothetical protein
MMCWGLRYCTARAHIVLAREQIVPAIVCGQNVKFSGCNSIHSTPSCLCRTWFLIQVTVLGFSYLCATWRSQNFYRVGSNHSPLIVGMTALSTTHLVLYKIIYFLPSYNIFLYSCWKFLARCAESWISESIYRNFR